MFGDPVLEPRTVDARLAQTLWRLSCDFDVIIDVHTPEFGWPHLYASSADTRLVTMDDIPHVLYGTPAPGPFDESHLRLRAKAGHSPVHASVTIELPSHEMPTGTYVDRWSQRLVDEIEAQGKSQDTSDSPLASGTMLDLVPKASGAVLLHCQPGAVLEKGAPLIEIVGRSGEREVLNAPGRCVPVCFRRATVVQAGYWACRVIAL
jgi:predicted deacylase